MDKNMLAELLQASQIPDTEKLKAITVELSQNYYLHPESLLLLVEIIATHVDNAVRQHAAIQAARLVPKHWSKTPQAQKAAVRQHLVDATMREPNAACRHAESHLIAALANIDLNHGEWPSLLPSLFELAGHADVACREVGSYIIYSILEESPNHFTPSLDKLLDLCGHTIRDPASRDVRVNAMLSVGSAAILINVDDNEPAVRSFQALIPPMVDVLKDAIESGEHDKTQQSFEVFQMLLGYESALVGNYLKDLIHFFVDLAANKDADTDVRSQSLAFLTQAVRHRRMKIQALSDLGALLVHKSLDILSEIDDDHDGSGDDDDDMSPTHAALALLDQLSSDLPPRQVMVPLLDAFPRLATATHPGQRKAGVLAIGWCVEGSPDFVMSQLTAILPYVIRLLNDEDVGVRHAALIGLARLAEELSTDLASEHEALIAALVKNLQAALQPAADAKRAKKNIGVVRAVCAALDCLSDGLSRSVMDKYASDLVDTIGTLVGHPDTRVKIAAAAALGAIAFALEQGFQPYFEKTMHALGAYLTVKASDDELALRSGVYDAMGRIATAVGVDMFQPYVVDLMRSTEECLLLDDSRLRESCFNLWSALAKVYGSHFSTFLPGVFKSLFESLHLDMEQLLLRKLGNHYFAKGKLSGKGDGSGGDDDDDDDDDNDNDDHDDDEAYWQGALRFRAEAMEKEAAIEVLGDVITNACSSADIQAYLEKAITIISPYIDHHYEGCCKAALATLWRSYCRVWQIMEEEEGGTTWEPGFPPKRALSPAVIKLGKIVTDLTLPPWQLQTERFVVCEINKGVAETLKVCGPAILTQDRFLPEMMSILTAILTRSHACQQDLGDEEGEQPEEVEGSSEYDWLVIDSALDTVISLAIATGPAFIEMWKVFEKPILHFVSSSDATERATAVGVIAECTSSMGVAVTPLTARLFPLIMKRLSDEHLEARSNATYAMGMLILHSNDTATYLPSYNTILAKLEPMLQIDESRLKDNAAGCVSRMIIAHPDQVPLVDVVPALVNLLPLKSDYQENAPVYQCIFKLYEQNEPTIQQLTPHLMSVFEQVFGPPHDQLDDDETRQLLEKLLRLLHQAQPHLFDGHASLLKVVGGGAA